MKKLLVLLLIIWVVGYSNAETSNNEFLIISIQKEDKSHSVIVENKTKRTIRLVDIYSPAWGVVHWFGLKVDGKKAKYLSPWSDTLQPIKNGNISKAKYDLRPNNTLKFESLDLRFICYEKGKDNSGLYICEPACAVPGIYEIIAIPNEKWPKDFKYKSVPYKYTVNKINEN
jgi:hypothetical protein